MLTKKDIEELGEILIERLSQEMDKTRPKGFLGRSGNSIATGNLKRSLNYGIIEDSDSFNIQIISLDYLGNLNSGRKPGKMPPIKAIEDWVKTKKLTDAKKTRQLAWAIAISIKKNGIKPTDIVDDVINKAMAELVNAISERGAQRLEQSIKVDFDTILPKSATIKM